MELRDGKGKGDFQAPDNTLPNCLPERLYPSVLLPAVHGIASLPYSHQHGVLSLKKTYQNDRQRLHFVVLIWISLIMGEVKHFFFPYVKHFFICLWPRGILIMVFECAKGLFGRLGPAVFEKQ